MEFLEEIDARDRQDGSPKLQRLRQVPPETGKFIAILAASCPAEGDFIEIGTSAGYSTLWLSLAAREKGIKIKTFEILQEKINLAKETFMLSGVGKYVDLVEGDFLSRALDIEKISFCFLDAEKELYKDCFQFIAPRLVTNGLLAADNAISHFEFIEPMMAIAEQDPRFDCMTVPVGKGVFICRRNTNQ